MIPKDYKTMQALERAFENNVLLRSCDEEQRGHIFDAMSEQTFTKGTVIIRQGDSGNFFYVIGEFLWRNRNLLLWNVVIINMDNCGIKF